MFKHTIRRSIGFTAIRTLRTTATAIPRIRTPATTFARVPAPKLSGSILGQRRNHTSKEGIPETKVYQFEDVQSLSQNPSPSRFLIDVREPSEFEAGHIPTAVNLPIASQPDGLALPDEEFRDRFGFEKPPKSGAELVFYCKAGVRSSAAAALAKHWGWENVGEYRGSWLDWEKRSQ